MRPSFIFSPARYISRLVRYCNLLWALDGEVFTTLFFGVPAACISSDDPFLLLCTRHEIIPDPLPGPEGITFLEGIRSLFAGYPQRIWKVLAACQ